MATKIMLEAFFGLALILAASAWGSFIALRALKDPFAWGLSHQCQMERFVQAHRGLILSLRSYLSRPYPSGGGLNQRSKGGTL